MGFDCGFDIYPRLEATASNKEAYRQFLDEIISRYDDVYDNEARSTDRKVLDVPTTSEQSEKPYIYFQVGEYPSMPCNPDHCDYFLRFSSKVSGSLTRAAEPYIKSVHTIAKKHFGSRVRFWHEMRETDDERSRGYYGWSEVHDAKKQLRELGKQDQTQDRAPEE